MKKIIIGILLLVPILIIFTINASGLIISAEVAIGIESLVLKHKGEEVTSVEIDYSYYQERSLKYQLIPVYLPGIAQNDGFNWTSSNSDVLTVDEGIVTFKECGQAKVTATSKSDRSKRASCVFYVDDDKVHSLTLSEYASGNGIADEVHLKQYEVMSVRASANPTGALGSNKLTWTSSNESVVKVDANGVLTAVTEGAAVINVSARGIAGNAVTRTFTAKVQGVQAVKSTELYSVESSYDMAEQLTGAYTVSGDTVSGTIVDLSAVAEGGYITVTVNGGGQSIAVNINRLSRENTLGINNITAILAGVWKNGNYIAVGSGNVTLEAVSLSTGEPVNANWSSNNTDAVRVDGGRLFGVGDGEAVITATMFEYQSVSITVNATVPISFFTLNLDNDDDKVGLGIDRVFGTSTLEDGVVKKGIQLSIATVYPMNANKSLFEYSTVSPYAAVSESGYITFLEGAEGKEITVTARSLFSAYNAFTTYTFKRLVDGVNVGLSIGNNSYDSKSGIMPSFQPYYDALAVNRYEGQQALVVHTDIYLPDKDTLHTATSTQINKLYFNRDMYGNGFKIDGQFYQYTYDSRIFASGDDVQLEGRDIDGIVIESLYIQSYAPTTGESDDAFAELVEKGGTPVRAYYRKYADFHITFQYCMFQYAYSHVASLGGTLTFDGCIFRNSVGPSINVQSAHSQPSVITINNCLFSNTLSMSGLLSNGSMPKEDDEILRYNTLNWSGNNYIYNWKKTEEVRMDIIPKGLTLDSNMNAILAQINNQLTKYVQTALRSKLNSSLVYRKDNEDYINMGYMCLGLWSELNPIINGERESDTDGFLINYDTDKYAFTMLDLRTAGISSAVKTISRGAGIDFDKQNYMLTNKAADGSYNTLPGQTYVLDEVTYAKLRGESA